MANTSQMGSQFEKERRTLDVIYDRLEIGVEKADMSAKRLGEEIGVGERTMVYVSVFEDLGILSRRMVFGTPTNGLSFGRHWYWTLIVTKEEAVKLLEASQVARIEQAQKNTEAGNQRRKQKRAEEADRRSSDWISTAIATDPAEETRAISGPDPDRRLGSLMSSSITALRKDESAALIAAARQYYSRVGSILKKIDELARLTQEVGVAFDRDKAIESIQYDVDERLEIVVDLLPYIDKLEMSVDRLSKQLVDQAEKNRDYDRMANENRAMRARIEKLIADRVAQSQTALSQ